MTRSSSPAFLVLVAACTLYWQRANLPESRELTVRVPVSGQVQVFSRGQILVWKRVTVSQDSITGIPVDSAARCHRCRQALPRNDVDSVRLEELSKTEKVYRDVFVVALSGLIVYGYATGPDCHKQVQRTWNCVD